MLYAIEWSLVGMQQGRSFSSWLTLQAARDEKVTFETVESIPRDVFNQSHLPHDIDHMARLEMGRA